MNMHGPFNGWFANFTIKNKLLFLAGVLLLALLLTNGIAGFSLYSLNSNVEGIQESSTNVTKHAENINSVLTLQQEELRKFELLNAATGSFLRLQFWLTDLSLSWLNESEENAEIIKERFSKQLTEIQLFAPDEAGKITLHLEKFYDLYLKAVDSYVDGNRVQGNAFLAKAKAEAIAVEDLLIPLKEKQHQAVVHKKLPVAAFMALYIADIMRMA